MQNFIPNHTAGGSYISTHTLIIHNNKRKGKNNLVRYMHETVTNDETGQSREAGIALPEKRVEIDAQFEQKEFDIIDSKTGQPLQLDINGKLTGAQIESLIFNLALSVDLGTEQRPAEHEIDVF